MTTDIQLSPETVFEARLEDYADLRSWGLTRVQAAARMGVSLRTAERYEASLLQRQDGGRQ